MDDNGGAGYHTAERDRAEWSAGWDSAGWALWIRREADLHCGLGRKRSCQLICRVAETDLCNIFTIGQASERADDDRKRCQQYQMGAGGSLSKLSSSSIP